MKIEVIISAYNNSEDLRKVLEGYCNQTTQDFEICIADDGSSEDLKAVIESFPTLKIRHQWHQDKGFRKAKICNQSIQTSNADYIVLTDSDCIPHPLFITDHRLMADESNFVTGVRIYLKADLSKQLRQSLIPITRLNSIMWLMIKSVIGQATKFEQAVRYPQFIIPLLKKIKPRMSRFGSNISMSRAALLEVNGFDEDFEGWGFEDTDLLWRLTKLGLSQKGQMGKCIQFHLYHHQRPENPKARELFNRKKKLNKIKCLRGIEKI